MPCTSSAGRTRVPTPTGPRARTVARRLRSPGPRTRATDDARCRRPTAPPCRRAPAISPGAPPAYGRTWVLSMPLLEVGDEGGEPSLELRVPRLLPPQAAPPIDQRPHVGVHVVGDRGPYMLSVLAGPHAGVVAQLGKSRGHRPVVTGGRWQVGLRHLAEHGVEARRRCQRSGWWSGRSGGVRRRAGPVPRDVARRISCGELIVPVKPPLYSTVVTSRSPTTSLVRAVSTTWGVASSGCFSSRLRRQGHRSLPIASDGIPRLDSDDGWCRCHEGALGHHQQGHNHAGQGHHDGGDVVGLYRWL